MQGRAVHDLDATAQAPARAQGELRLALEVEGGGFERLVEIEALRRNPGNVDEQHGGRPQTSKLYRSTRSGQLTRARHLRLVEPRHGGGPRLTGVGEPPHVGLLVPEPRPLPFREAQGLRDDRPLRLLDGRLAAHGGHRLPVPDGPERPQLRAVGAPQEAPDLVQQPPHEHLAGARLHGSSQRLPARVEAHDERPEAPERLRCPALLLGDRPARRPEHLQGPHHADAVSRGGPAPPPRDRPGRGGRCSRASPNRSADSLEAAAEGVVTRGPLEEAVRAGARR